MKVLNFGSLNIDRVYTVPHLIKEKETLAAVSLSVFCGGKGLNQSIALARAGISVFHAGKTGADGEFLKSVLEKNGVDTTYILSGTGESGHAVIQVDKNGQNGILLFGGANMMISKEEADLVLKDFASGDVILLQNEISELSYILDKAAQKGMIIYLNPSPVKDNLSKCKLESVNTFILNEVEGEAMTGEKEWDKICGKLEERYPQSRVMLTLGERGAVYCEKKERIYRQAERVEVTDTTAAGDTFTGFFIASILKGYEPRCAVDIATRAAAIAVSRKGAEPSIPTWKEVECRG